MYTKIKFPLDWKQFYEGLNNSYLELRAVSQSKASESSYSLRFKNGKIGELTPKFYRNFKVMHVYWGGCSFQQKDSGYIVILTVKLYNHKSIDIWTAL